MKKIILLFLLFTSIAAYSQNNLYEFFNESISANYNIDTTIVVNHTNYHIQKTSGFSNAYRESRYHINLTIDYPSLRSKNRKVSEVNEKEIKNICKTLISIVAEKYLIEYYNYSTTSINKIINKGGSEVYNRIQIYIDGPK